MQSTTIFGQTYDKISYNIRYDNEWDIENSWGKRRDKIKQLLDYYKPSIFGIQVRIIKSSTLYR